MSQVHLRGVLHTERHKKNSDTSVRVAYLVVETLRINIAETLTHQSSVYCIRLHLRTIYALLLPPSTSHSSTSVNFSIQFTFAPSLSLKSSGLFSHPAPRVALLSSETLQRTKSMECDHDMNEIQNYCSCVPVRNVQ